MSSQPAGGTPVASPRPEPDTEPATAKPGAEGAEGTAGAEGAEGTAESEGAAEPTVRAASPAGSVGGAIVLAVLSYVWLGLLVFSALATLGAPGDGVLGITETAYGLPAVIFAALIAGAGLAQAVRRAADRWLGSAPVARFAAMLGCGASTGAGAAAVVVLGDGRGGSAVAILGWVLFTGATVGGSIVGVHRRAGLLTGATVAAALTVSVLTTARELLKGPLLDLFGAGDTPASVLAAQSRVTWITALLAGVAAGVVAFGYLHVALRRARQTLLWPAYLLAGAGTGIMLLVSELVTRIGGAQLLNLARSFSESDDAFQTMANAARINSALVILFAGAFTALICLGRALPARTAAD
ncbi:hypothetical protein O7632_07465 [Solwaraspora sp. WMMD406]|uniref:hypothetical protein n=1 Tax=Solwaraspora sp. WMMD406 TaxID=3016095 RepID=UPI002417F1DB|nr:hypothetical protein [Solwaraspora sp. WMMD406]MDG4763947.1 hypothetical protein [Solwaraspora sp. WMMD406]